LFWAQKRIKFKQLDHWQYQYFDTVLEFLTGTRKKCQSGQENEETANHPWTALPKGKHRSLVCSQKTGRKGPDELEEAYTVEIMKLVEYVDRKEDTLIQIVRMHQHNINSVVLQIARRLKTEVEKGTRQIKDGIAGKTKERWEWKKMYGQLPCNLDEKLVDNKHSY